ncbi:MAG: hypothetical protein VXZ35_09805, partial [Pseudomonadota bacterium]|nr:hypothetical protein [Pseudomonadota bacterium]
ILHADNIAVMEQGRLVAQGTHTQLLDSSPLYRRLADLQFQEAGRERGNGTNDTPPAATEDALASSEHSLMDDVKPV